MYEKGSKPTEGTKSTVGRVDTQASPIDRLNVLKTCSCACHSPKGGLCQCNCNMMDTMQRMVDKILDPGDVKTKMEHEKILDHVLGWVSKKNPLPPAAPHPLVKVYSAAEGLPPENPSFTDRPNPSSHRRDRFDLADNSDMGSVKDKMEIDGVTYPKPVQQKPIEKILDDILKAGGTSAWVPFRGERGSIGVRNKVTGEREYGVNAERRLRVAASGGEGVAVDIPDLLQQLIDRAKTPGELDEKELRSVASYIIGQGRKGVRSAEMDQVGKTLQAEARNRGIRLEG